MAFEYVIVKEEFEFKEEAQTEVLPAVCEEETEAECNKKNISVESVLSNNLGTKIKLEDDSPDNSHLANSKQLPDSSQLPDSKPLPDSSQLPDSKQLPDSSQTDNNTWLVAIKEEIEEVHPETFLQIDIEIDQESENDEAALGSHSSDDSEIQPAPYDDGDYDPDSKPGSFRCTICKISYSTAFNLQRHLLRHQNALKCQQCDSLFYTQARLNSHIVNRHTNPGDRLHSCDVCQKTFKTSSNLQQHKKTHLVDKPFQCTKCSQTFSFKSNFQKHQTKPCPVITTKEPLICGICDKVFEKEYLLKSHLRKHDTDRPYSCEECTMTFKHKSTLMRHSHVHSGVRPYPCPHCGKTFTSSGLLKPHLRVHTGEKPYKCEVCPKMFAHKHNMQRHMIGHRKIKHTVCDICHKEFPRESRLRYHMKTHINEKFFICKVCPKRFSHKQNVIRHYSRKHPGKTYSCEETDASVAAKVWDTVKKRFDEDDEPEEILG